MSPPPADTTATQGDGKPKIGKQDLPSTPNQDLGQGFTKPHSSIYAMGLSNPDTYPHSLLWTFAHTHACK